MHLRNESGLWQKSSEEAGMGVLEENAKVKGSEPV